MVKRNIMAFFNREYPLIRLFEYGDDILMYDAKPHFAFIISKEEMEVLVDFLNEKPENEIINTEYSHYDGGLVKQLLFKFNELKNSGVFIKGPVSEVSTVDRNAIKEKLEYFDQNILLKKFCLQVTENCNFRCKYCKRTLDAEHADNNMSEEHAYQGIRYYFDKYTVFFSKLPLEKKGFMLQILSPTLSFYGGEPFLNFALIKKCTDYFKSLPWEDYSIPLSVLGITVNSNLSIMNDEIISFLVKHRVTLFASLDGPAEEHNKCRVFKNGKGTFDVAYSNLMKIKRFNPQYFKEKVSIFGVYTTEHDYKKCVNFTQDIGVTNIRHFPADYSGVFVNNLEAERNYYQKDIENNLAGFRKMVLASDDIDRDMDKFHNIFPFAKLKYDNPKGNNSLDILLTCPMGFDNLMVAANGDFLVCHKAHGMPVGNCATGIDYEKLIDLFQQYNTAINNSECKNCWNVQFCNICAVSRMGRTGFVNPKKEECDLFRLRKYYDFLCFIHLSLEQPTLLEKIINHRNDPKCYIGVIDINDF